MSGKFQPYVAFVDGLPNDSSDEISLFGLRMKESDT